MYIKIHLQLAIFNSISPFQKHEIQKQPPEVLYKKVLLKIS